MSDLLAANQVSARYSKTGPLALSDVSLSLTPGSWVGVVGPNGSGKSTLVRVLSRALRPERGVVMLGGKDLYRERSSRDSARCIAVVPQFASPSLDFSVADIVAMGRFPQHARGDAGIVDQAMADSGCLAFAERRATAVSGGEWQRVLLARALAQQTSILLLDEPTAHVDIGTQRPLLNLVRRQAREHGKAVLSVLHDLNLAAEYCDGIVLVSEGKVLAAGTPSETLTAEALSTVYGTRVWVRPHPAANRPLVLTLPELGSAGSSGKPRIQVLCGAGTGAALLLCLKEMGYEPTAGALNAGDTDREIADLLGIAYAGEDPFTPLSERALRDAAAMSARAAAVIVTNMPYGPSNIGLLGLAEKAAAAGVPVALLEPATDRISDRDFTGGAAGRKRDQLIAGGAACLSDQQAVIAWLSVTVGNEQPILA